MASDSCFGFESRFWIVLHVFHRKRLDGVGRGGRLRISRQRCVDHCATGFWNDRDLVDAFRPWELDKGISNASDVI